MKRSIFILVLLSLTVSGFSQTKLQGILLDSLSKQAEPYATIRAFKGSNTSKPQAMSLTSEEGVIDFDINDQGDYLITISSIGKREVRLNVSLNGQKTLNLGTIYSATATGEINEVEVVASKPVVKMEADRMTYSVKDDEDAQTLTVLDMLRKVPMVTVDAQDNISVNGSGSFKVLVNGKPNVQLQSNAKIIFKMMPASMVDKIEVITNPGAKYDAEGVGGVLDITMKNASGGSSQEALDGYNGEASLRGGNTNSGASVNLSGQKKKFTYSFNAYGGIQNLDDLQLENTMKNFTSAGESTSMTEMSLKQDITYAGASLGMGLELDSMSNVNATLGFNNFTNKQKGTATATFSGPLYGSGFSYVYDQETRTRSTGFNASADYQRFLNKARTSNIIISYQFSTSPNRNKDWRHYYDVTGLPSISFGDSYSDSRPRGTEHTLQIDYTTPLGHGNTLNAGAKYISHINHADSRYYDVAGNVETLNELSSTLYENHQRIAAAYAEHSSTLGKWSTREGLRYEHTWEDIDFPNAATRNFNKNYGSLVPSASISYNITPTTNLGLNYSLRITRPGISYLNPYINRSNPILLEYGNPGLDVEKAHTINIVFNTYTARFMANATLSQSFCNNQIAQYSFTDNTNILNTTFGNNVKNRWTNLNTWMRWVAGKNTSVMFNGYAGYGDIRSSALDAHNYGWQFDGNMMLEQTLPWSVKMTLGVQASNKRYNIQGYNGGMAFSFLVLTKSIMKEKLTFTLLGANPLDNRLNIDSYSSSQTFENKMHVGVPIRMLQFTVSWKFGNSQKNFQQHQSRISSEYEEHKSTGSQVGSMSTGGIGQ